MKSKTRFSGIVGALLCAVVVISACAACSSSGSSAPKTATQKTLAVPSTSAAAGMADQATENKSLAATSSGAAATGTSAAASTAAALSKQKIIEKLSYQIETLKFDESSQMIQSLCTQLGGYMQSSSVDGKGIQVQNLRTASFVLRIPQEKLSQFKNSAGNIGSILNFTSSSENISDQYFDTEARLKSLRTQQERLLALLTKSGSLKDVIDLEKALEDVNYQIEQLTGTLRQYDSLIGFSTVTVQLNEVVKTTVKDNIPVTLGDKIAQQFKQSLRALGNFGEGLLVFFVGGAPIILVLAVIVVVVIVIILKRKKHEQTQEEQSILRINMAREKNDRDEHPDK